MGLDLTPDVVTIVFQIVNFLVLALALYWLLFRPVMRSMKQRAAERERLDYELSQELETVAVTRGQLQARLAEADEEADAIVEAAQERAFEIRAAMLQHARDETERVLAEAHVEAQRVRSQAAGALQVEAVDTILEISGELIARAAPPEVHDRLIQQLIDRIWEMGRTEMQRVDDFRRSLGDRIPTAHILTARPLSADQQGLLARTLTALADRHVDLEVRDDPSLAAGLRVRLADIVVDSSVAGQLEQLRLDTLETLRAREQALEQSGL